MNTQRKKNNYGKEFWKKHIKNWEKSGLNKSEYCRQNNLGYYSFLDWIKRINREDMSCDFVKLPLGEKETGNCYKFTLDDRIKIEAPLSADPTKLTTIIKALREKL
jgi:hypothetical protein